MLHRLIFLLLLAALCACNGQDPVIDVFPKPEILDISATEGEDYSSVVLTCRVSSGDRIKDYGFYFGPADGVDFQSRAAQRGIHVHRAAGTDSQQRGDK